MENPPRIGGSRDLTAGLQRGDQHVDRRHQEENREQNKEEIRPAQRPAPVAAHAAIFRTLRAALHGPSRYRAHASFPRRVMSRRMNVAAMARIGTMNSETLAPSGMSPP